MNIQSTSRGDLPRIAATLNKVLKSDARGAHCPGGGTAAGDRGRLRGGRAARGRVARAARADAPDHGLSRRQRRVPLGPHRRGGPRHGRLPRRLRGRRGGDPYRWDVRQRLTRSQTHRAQRAPRAPPAARPRRRPRRSRLPRRRSGRTGGHVGAWRLGPHGHAARPRAGRAARAFAAVHHAGISVSLISQASSEQSICFSVPEDQAERARRGLDEAFQREIGRQEIDRVEVRAGAATLVVVGLGMAGTPGIAARVFSALAEAKINVIAIAQGSSELNLSLVVDAGDAARALRVVHDAFQLSKIGGGMGAHPERSDVVLLGFGQIGRTLAPLIAKAKHGVVRLQIVGLVDRSGFVFDPTGLSPRRLADLAAAKAKGTPLAKAKGGGGHRGSATEAVTFAARHALSNPILVDVTAADTTETLKTALAAGMHVVLANKRPITVSRKRYDELRATAEAHGRQLLHEATVGAGLPIMDTYAKLVGSGDRVQRIEGCPSGTLGYLFGELGRGRRFSQALRGAIAKGYPEPDPRDDLPR